MKRLTAFILCICMLFSLAACGKKNDGKENVPDPVPDNSPAPDSGQNGGGNTQVDVITSATLDIDSVPRYKGNSNSSILVVYFSTDDTVRAVALHAAKELGADIFEIVPEVPYTEDDINYRDPDYRVGKEQKENARPAIKSMPEDMSRYKTILLGYPIWGGQAPNILYTFLENADIKDADIYPFCTSNSSNAGSSAINMHGLTDPSVTWHDAFRMIRNGNVEDVRNWVISLELEGDK